MLAAARRDRVCIVLLSRSAKHISTPLEPRYLSHQRIATLRTPSQLSTADKSTLPFFNDQNAARRKGVCNTSTTAARRTSFRATSPERPNRGVYCYQPLKTTESIRHLILHPGDFNDDIRVTIHQGHQGEAYEALSYVWRDPYAERSFFRQLPQFTPRKTGPLCPIICDGYRIGVTPNLYLGLRRLRLIQRARVLWVDSLCINQADVQERNAQVALMSSIFAKASRVIIWLGEQDAWTERAMKTISSWADIYNSDTESHQPALLRKLTESGTFQEDQASFEALMRRSWFTRAWTFQELCLSRSAELVCGQYSIPWRDLRNACGAVIEAGQRHFVFRENANIKTLHDFWNFTREMPDLASRRGDERFNLSRLLQRTRLQEASDPRDKIYSLLGIANKAVRNRKAFDVDYSLPVQEVYSRFTKAMITEDGDLDILSSVKRPRRDRTLEQIAQRRGISATPDLPSWVPDLQDQDCVEYVAQDENMQSELPEDQYLTRFPQPIAQQYNEGWPRYWLNKKFSYRVHGNITFDAGSSARLGLYGIPVGTVTKAFPMAFTEDPFVRVPVMTVPNKPDVSADAAFDWQRIFTLHKDANGEPQRVLLDDIYRPTGENMSIAVLRTRAADLLPISRRLLDFSRKTYFPRHFDWYFWHRRLERQNLFWRKKSRNNALLILFSPLQSFQELWSILKARRNRISAGGQDVLTWNALDDRALEDPDLVYELYLELFDDSIDKAGLDLYGEPVKYGVTWFGWAWMYGHSQGWLKGAIAKGLFYSLRGLPFILATGLIWIALFTTLSWAKQPLKANAIPGEPHPAVPAMMRDMVTHSGMTMEWEMAVEVQNAINRASWNRWFFITDNGYIGIGPIGTQPGDKVYALIGGHVPFVLRPTSREGEFQLVGESYVHGIMDGELWTERAVWNDLEKMKASASKVVLV